MRRHVLRTHTAGSIAGNGVVDECRIWKLQLRHQLDERLERTGAAEPWIAGTLLTNRRYAAVLIVMRGVDKHIVTQREQLFRHASVQRACIAILEVRAAAAID